MKKRGTSQIDWILSLSIFLLFIAWFFMYMMPQLNYTTNRDSVITLLQNRFNSEYSWELTKFPLFLESNDTSELEPVFVNYSVNQTNIKFTDDTNYIIWNNKLIMLANITDGVKTYWIIKGSIYDQTFNYSGLNIEQNSVSSDNLSVQFTNSMPDKIYFKDQRKINNMNYKINEILFSPVSNDYIDYSFVGLYTARTQNINHTSMIFKDNQKIYNFINSDTEANYTFEINIDLLNYNSYYSNNDYYGSFSYSNTTQSLNFTSDYITIYGKEAMSMFFQDDVEFNFTYYNTTLSLDLNMPVTTNYEYKIMFHDGNYNNIDEVSYNSRFGVRETLSGIFLGNISTNYSFLKNKWNIPRTFNIRVYQNSSSYIYLYEPDYEIGTYNPGRNKVFAETQDIYSLSNNGELKPLSINYRIW